MKRRFSAMLVVGLATIALPAGLPARPVDGRQFSDEEPVAKGTESGETVVLESPPVLTPSLPRRSGRERRRLVHAPWR